jgi:hypothetical protein
MFSKPLVVGLLAASCVTAAAGGAYIAARQNAAPINATGAATPTAASAVRETEALVAPLTAAAEPAPIERPRAAAETTRPPAPAAPPTSGKAMAKTEPVRPHPANRAEKLSDKTASAAASPKGAGTPEPAAAAPAPATVPEAAASRPDSSVAAEPARPEPAHSEPVAPPAPETIELVVPTASVIGLQIETPITSERARIEDRVEARVMRDVAVDGRTAIPAGTRALGSVTLVDRGGKVTERARLGVRFHTLVLADGTQLPIRTETILREGEPPTGESARKIGGAAVGGAILGAIMGGKKGAIVGGATGAAGGTAVVMAGDRNAATLPVGAVVTVRLSSAVPVEVEKR